MDDVVVLSARCYMLLSKMSTISCGSILLKKGGQSADGGVMASKTLDDSSGTCIHFNHAMFTFFGSQSCSSQGESQSETKIGLGKPTFYTKHLHTKIVILNFVLSQGRDGAFVRSVQCCVRIFIKVSIMVVVSFIYG